jgi:hypothetical protein
MLKEDGAALFDKRFCSVHVLGLCRDLRGIQDKRAAHFRIRSLSATSNVGSPDDDRYLD